MENTMLEQTLEARHPELKEVKWAEKMAADPKGLFVIGDTEREYLEKLVREGHGVEAKRREERTAAKHPRIYEALRAARIAANHPALFEYVRAQRIAGEHLRVEEITRTLKVAVKASSEVEDTSRLDAFHEFVGSASLGLVQKSQSLKNRNPHIWWAIAIGLFILWQIIVGFPDPDARQIYH